LEVVPKRLSLCIYKGEWLAKAWRRLSKPCKVICILEGIGGKYESNNYVHHDIAIATSKHLLQKRKKSIQVVEASTGIAEEEDITEQWLQRVFHSGTTYTNLGNTKGIPIDREAKKHMFANPITSYLRAYFKKTSFLHYNKTRQMWPWGFDY
jgi:hypothetical protein